MQIVKGSITILAAEGRLTLQIPGAYIGCKPEMEEAPDDWFIVLKDNRPVVNKREHGFLFLSKKGWEANNATIKAAFAGNSRGTTWEQMEVHAAEHFAAVERGTEKYLQGLRDKIAAVEQVTL